MDYSKIQANINDGQFNFDTIDLADFDAIKVKDGSFHLLKDKQTYIAKVIAQDYNNKEFTITINGHAFHIQLLDQYDQMVKSLGLSKVQATKINEIKAPMPGLILDILVKPGDTIEEGSPLLILEAMKMENVIKSQGDAIVKSINTNKGDAVEKGQILIEME